MARIHNYIGRETVLKRKWLDIMIDSELVEESQGMASTRRKLVVNRLWTDNTIGSGIVPYRNSAFSNQFYDTGAYRYDQ